MSNRKHIAIIDGTLSRLNTGEETHCGRLYKMALHLDPKIRRVHYDRGVQGKGWLKWLRVASGVGLSYSVARIYRKLAENYREGDEIYLFGYSRGAYAIRMVAGIINRVGLLRPEYATRENVERAIYLSDISSDQRRCREFRKNYSHDHTPIQFLGVWDTVKALGAPIPLLHQFSPLMNNFKDHAVPANVQRACHAIARDETRIVFEPETWKTHSPTTSVTQMIFAGVHSTIGGDLSTNNEAIRRLSNCSFLWIVEEAIKVGFVMPEGWQNQFICDPSAKSPKNGSMWRFLTRYRSRHFYPPEYFTDHHSIAGTDDPQQI